MLKTVVRIGAPLACVMLMGFAASAADKPTIDTGDTAWLLVATALVLMMNIPGLALFYAGMVRKKNVLATAVQAFAGKRQAVADYHPEDRAEGDRGERLRHGGENVLLAHHAGIEQR